MNLNLSPDLVSCSQAASAIFAAVPIEEAIVMQHETEGPYALDAELSCMADLYNAIATVCADGFITAFSKTSF